MTLFISYADQIKQVLARIVASDALHAKWLNTLSFLENCGAKKIAACEHPTLVKQEMLKHAAEEFRHAYHLKRQIEKLSTKPIETFATTFILGGMASLHYLVLLDVKIARYLKQAGLAKAAIKQAAYLLVTYAIERRADELYHIYDEILKNAGSKVGVKSILLEEKEHLNEMIEGLDKIPLGSVYAEHICAIESNLCKTWLDAVAKNLGDVDEDST